MKQILILALVFVTSTVSLAQESDTTKTEPKPQPADTIPNPPQQPQVEEDDTPKIIYYQSTERDKKRDRRQDIKTLSGSMSHSGGFGALSFRSTKFRDESMVLGGLRGGWIINRTLGIGIEGHGIIPTAKFDDIEAGQEVNILGGYGGMFLELIFFSPPIAYPTS